MTGCVVPNLDKRSDPHPLQHFTDWEALGTTTEALQDAGLAGKAPYLRHPEDRHILGSNILIKPTCHSFQRLRGG